MVNRPINNFCYFLYSVYNIKNMTYNYQKTQDDNQDQEKTETQSETSDDNLIELPPPNDGESITKSG